MKNQNFFSKFLLVCFVMIGCYLSAVAYLCDKGDFFAKCLLIWCGVIGCYWAAETEKPWGDPLNNRATRGDAQKIVTAIRALPPKRKAAGK